MKPQIYLSYARSENNDILPPLVEKLNNAIKRCGFELLIDIHQVKYKDSISTFMKKIGKGKYIIIIVDEKYMRSKFCMFEMVEIFKHANIRDRIFPIIYANSNIYDPVELLNHILYWQGVSHDLSEKIKSLPDISIASAFIEDLETVMKFPNAINSLNRVIRDLNVLTIRAHESSNFAELISAISDKVSLEPKEISVFAENLTIEKGQSLEKIGTQNQVGKKGMKISFLHDDYDYYHKILIISGRILNIFQIPDSQLNKITIEGFEDQEMYFFKGTIINIPDENDWHSTTINFGVIDFYMSSELNEAAFQGFYGRGILLFDMSLENEEQSMNMRLINYKISGESSRFGGTKAYSPCKFIKNGKMIEYTLGKFSYFPMITFSDMGNPLGSSYFSFFKCDTTAKYHFNKAKLDYIFGVDDLPHIDNKANVIVHEVLS